MTHYAGEQIRASHFFDMISFTPTIANYGTATFTTNSGVYVRIGDLVWTNIYIVVGRHQRKKRRYVFYLFIFN